jgi:hypothetical protein
MDKSHDVIIAELRNNLKQIINLYQKKKEENRELRAENQNLKKTVLTLKKETDNYTVKYDTLQLAKTFTEASGSSHDAKIKVNRIVREIDKCIALLNK